MVRQRAVLLASVLALASVFVGCRDSKPDYFGFPPPVDTTTSTGGRSGTGGKSGAGKGGASGAMGAPDAVAPAPNMDAHVDGVADALVPDGAPDVVATDGPADLVVSETAPDVTPPRADAAPDTTPSKGPAACYPDSKVIRICHQLESACNNCPGGGTGTKPTMDCYAVVQRGDDAACAKYAADKKCTVDPGGNVCGSLNCGVGSGPPVAAGCNRMACRTAQGNGDSAMCMRYLAACPCK